MSSAGTPRGLLFGTAAESYERFRLGYPDEVVVRTLSHADRPVASAVEVGAGTGKATRAFASRGIRVAALEPDPEMYAVLQRETAAMPVQTVLTTFEAYDGPPTDLVYAAASWHWTDPSTRWTHAADLLDPGGVLAIFGSQLRLVDPVLEEAVSVALADPADDSAFLPKGEPSGPGWGVADIEGVGAVRGRPERRAGPARDRVPAGVHRPPVDGLGVPATRRGGPAGRAAPGPRARSGRGDPRRLRRAAARPASLSRLSPPGRRSPGRGRWRPCRPARRGRSPRR